MGRTAGLYLAVVIVSAGVIRASAQERVGPAGVVMEGSVWNPWKGGKDDRALKVKVLVLNYDPLVPSEKNRRLSEVFQWGSPERLAARFKAEMEFAAGGYLKFEIVEWRNLNEIYALKDGYRYKVEEYVFNRRNNSGWHKPGEPDYPGVLEEQEVAALIDAGKVDEVWIFSDHYFGVWEASMAGPGAFFINGGVYPQVPSQRPFAFYGFNYERGVAEMMHDASHRTESTLNRVYGQWNLKEPRSNWDKFSANDQQSNGVAGVGTCHWPANANGDYDYGNERVVQSWADDYLNYPNLTFTKKPVSRATWGRGAGNNAHLDYMSWYFAHVPRAAGVNPDGRQNNWWKYIMDFQNYNEKGEPKPLAARVTARDVYLPRAGEYKFTVAYMGAVAVDVSSIDGNDLVVTGPGGFVQGAKLVEVSDRENGTHRVATYALAGPAGGWQEAQSGKYRIAIQGNQVKDVAGTFLTAGELGGFSVQTAEGNDGLKADIPNLELAIRDRGRLRVNATGKGMTSRDVTAEVSWTAADAKIATVDEMGHVRGIGAGKTTITATLGSLVEKVTVTVKDTGRPLAKLAKAPDHTASDKPYEFSVVYTDDEALVEETIGFGDVRVTGPNGFHQFAEFVSQDAGNDRRVRTGTYRVLPAGGKWWSSGNGTYAIEVKGWQVGDAKGQYVAEGVLGSFRVNVKETEPEGGMPPTFNKEEARARKAAAKQAKTVGTN